MLAKFACGPWHRYTVYRPPVVSLDLIFNHFSSKYISSVSMGANLSPGLPPLPPLVKKLDKNKWKTTQKIITIYPSGALLKDNVVFLDIALLAVLTATICLLAWITSGGWLINRPSNYNVGSLPPPFNPRTGERSAAQLFTLLTLQMFNFRCGEAKKLRVHSIAKFSCITVIMGSVLCSSSVLAKLRTSVP